MRPRPPRASCGGIVPCVPPKGVIVVIGLDRPQGGNAPFDDAQADACNARRGPLRRCDPAALAELAHHDDPSMPFRRRPPKAAVLFGSLRMSVRRPGSQRYAQPRASGAPAPGGYPGDPGPGGYVAATVAGGGAGGEAAGLLPAGGALASGGAWLAGGGVGAGVGVGAAAAPD